MAYPVYHIIFTDAEDNIVAEQSNVRAESLYHLIRVLVTDFREELDTCAGLKISLEAKTTAGDQ